MEIENVISIAMWSLFGLFFWFIMWGIIWGAIRGTKRAGLRLATLTVSAIVALLLTPLISRMFVGIFYRSAGHIVEDAITDSGNLGYQIVNEAGQVITFMQAMMAVMVNFVVFFAVYYFFKAVSWIVYFFLARRFAPAKRADGTPTKRYRWGGVGIGVATGFILFLFAMIPVAGFMRSFDQVATYQSTFAGFNKMTYEDRREIKDDGGIAGSLLRVDREITNANTQIQSSAFGRLTRFTGMQLFGGWAMGYLSTVRAEGTRVNMRNDMVNIGKLVNDGLAVAVEVTRDGGIVTRMQDWYADDYQALQEVVNRIFDIGIVRFALSMTGVLVDILEDNGTLDDAFLTLASNSANERYTDIQVEYNGGYRYLTEAEAFVRTGYATVRAFTNPDTVAREINNLIDNIKIAFTTTMYNDLRRVVNGNDLMQSIVDLDVRPVATVLNNVTNSTTLGNFITELALTHLRGFDSNDGGMGGVDMSDITNVFIDELESEDGFDWLPILESVQSIAVFIIGVTNILNDIDEILNSGNPMELADRVVELILEDVGNLDWIIDNVLENVDLPFELDDDFFEGNQELIDEIIYALDYRFDDTDTVDALLRIFNISR